MTAGGGGGLSRTGAKRLVDLGAAIVESAHDRRASLARASYDALLPSVAGVVPATYFLSHRIVPEGEGLGWDFASIWSADRDGDRLRERFGRFLSVRRAALSFKPGDCARS